MRDSLDLRFGGARYGRVPSEPEPSLRTIRRRLDPVIHSPVRLSIMACLNATDRAEFGFVRDTVEVSNSVLSKQASNLEDAGYVKAKKGCVGKYPRTWLSLTAAGQRAFDDHLAALAAIVWTPPVPTPEPTSGTPTTTGR